MQSFMGDQVIISFSHEKTGQVIVKYRFIINPADLQKNIRLAKLFSNLEK